MVTLLLAFWSLVCAPAQASELEQVRVFVGEGHARVLLVADGALHSAQPRCLAAAGGVRCELELRGVTLDERLARSYPQREQSSLIPVEEGGVNEVLLTPRAGGLELAFSLDGRWELQRQPLQEGALLLDLRLAGADEDPSLPEAELLQLWLDGVSLARKGGEISKPRPLVVIDPGHGGEDPGARGLTGTHEADVALALSRRLATALHQRMDVDVVLTRETDVFIPLGDRAAMANALDADLFISVHANAAPGPTAWGITTFYMDTASDAGAARVAARENAIIRQSAEPLDRLVAELSVTGTNRLSAQLAGGVQDQVVTQLRQVYGQEQIRDLGVQTALFYVLVSTGMPAILYESSFLTHPGDEARLRLPAFQQITAEAMADAVVAWLATQEQ